MLWIILGVVAVILLWGVATYNGLIRLRTWVAEAWSQIDVQLKRRNDLIPNLLETVKGYAKHERETLAEVVNARNQLTQAQGSANPQEIMEASNQLSGALKTVFALAEAYPDLKANTNFLELQEELTNTENKIAYARQLYNSQVSQYNIKIETIPSNIIASLFKFKLAERITIKEEEKEVPKIQF